ncbi:MAG: molybdopterin-binding/glycosyltransferase family 2 protein [Rhizobiales bacterium]|nr:molybdopterin-binding/glycosyltransferase family 2 protein [Hyphomicrobiales bacterium]
MRLVELPVRECEGALLAHAQDGLLLGKKKRVKKGTQLSAEHIQMLVDAGHELLMVAQLGADDVHENEAANMLANGLAGSTIIADPAFTGRSNLFAKSAGLLVLDEQIIHGINKVDPSITLATLPPFNVVEEGRMVATAKIIPFAVPKNTLNACISLAGAALRVAPFTEHRVGLIATQLPTLKPSVMDKTRRVLDDRLRPSGSTIVEEIRVPHREEAVCDALAKMSALDVDLIILFGASAMMDAQDVLPAALAKSGGKVDYVGMPVDPGNLLFIGGLNSVPVIGAPGCSRSPAENGFDWVLNRVLAGLIPTGDDIAAMGVGGLLMEIVSRPQPRQQEAEPIMDKPNIAALVLAAGQSSRMGPNNKLIARLNGKELVCHVADAALESVAMSVHVVTGAEPEKVKTALDGRDLAFIQNPGFANGLSTSLRAGLVVLAEAEKAPDGVIVLLGDMPDISTQHIDLMIAAFNPAEGREIIVATNQGKRGNPVLWSSRFFNALTQVQGDTGGRHLIGESSAFVHEVEIGDSASFDLDTPQALAAAGGQVGD